MSVRLIQAQKRIQIAYQIKAVRIYRVRCESINTPVVPVGIVDEIEQRGPRVICVEFVRPADIRTSVSKALLRRIKDDARDKAAAASNLHILPSVGLGCDRAHKANTCK